MIIRSLIMQCNVRIIEYVAECAVRCKRLAAVCASGLCVYGLLFGQDSTGISKWTGLRGNDLLKAVGVDSRPEEYVTQYMHAGGLWEIYKLIDGDNGRNGYVDRFSGDVRPYGQSDGWAPENCSLIPIVPAQWWNGSSGNRQFIEVDMYNLYPSSDDMLHQRESLPPGMVDAPVFDNSVWRVGIGNLEGDRAWLWQPPAGFEGDVARVMFYMLAVYGDGVIPFTGPAGRFVSYAGYPFFTEAAARQLVAWHRSDPVDTYEINRNEVIASRQRNQNPFVVCPELVEYLWGWRQGEAFVADGSGGDIPSDPETDRSPLRARYSVGDSRINLVSPCIPSGVAWSVDGSPVSDAWLVPSELGVGLHELTFAGRGCHGKVMIEILP